MESTPPLDLGLAVTALRQRSERELARLSGSAAVGTEAVGGWAKVGSCLDAVFRNAFCQMCLGAGRPVEGEFQRLSGQPSWVTAKGTAGQFAAVVPMLARELGGGDARVAAVVSAARDPRSAPRRAIEARNVMVHDRAQPEVAALVALLRDLIAWCDAPGR